MRISYKAFGLTIALAALLALTLALGAGASEGEDVALDKLPIKGQVTLVDLGADQCMPCRMMAPILEEIRAEYKGRAAVVFLDVWQRPEAARHFGVRMIPTQIFYDAKGQEVARHTGFMPKEALVAMFTKLGVEPAAAKTTAQ